jgi:hypothetical protein
MPSERRDQILRITEKLDDLWVTQSHLTFEQLLEKIEPALFKDPATVSDDEVEWAIDHYNDEPYTGN